jgi:hypothetical protein
MAFSQVHISWRKALPNPQVLTVQSGLKFLKYSGITIQQNKFYICHLFRLALLIFYLRELRKSCRGAFFVLALLVEQLFELLRFFQACLDHKHLLRTLWLSLFHKSISPWSSCFCYSQPLTVAKWEWGLYSQFVNSRVLLEITWIMVEFSLKQVGGNECRKGK